MVDVLNRHQSEFGQLCARSAPHRAAIESAKKSAARVRQADLSAEEHVVGDRQRRRQGEILIDGLDAGFARIERRLEIDGLAGEHDLAGVRNHRSAQRLDHGRFTFTVFPNDGIRIDPHMIRRVTSYDGALLEEAHPEVHDVVSPDVARTMTAMLEEVIQFGTGIQAKALGRPAAGKTGTTQDYTDAWFVGYTPQLTAGVWVGFDDKQISLGKKETGARAALPIWLEFMQSAMAGTPTMDFANVVPLEQQVSEHHVNVDTPDTAPTEDEPAAPKEKPPAALPTVTRSN